MGTVRVKYFETRKLRDGTLGYVWNNRHARQAGMACEWLGTDEVAAIDRAKKLNAMWEDIRKARNAPSGPIANTVAWMALDIEKSEEHKERRKKLQQEVERAFRVICSSPMGKAKLTAVTGRDVTAFRKKLHEAKGISKAQETCKWFRHLFNVAKQQRLLTVNPMDGLRIPRPPARQVYWLEEEVNAVIAKAHEMDRASIGLAIRLAFDTGQREGDVLSMLWSHLIAGDITVKQHKGGASVRIQCLPELTAALASTAKTSTHLVVSETTHRPYKQYNFVHVVGEVIEAAGFAGKRYGDLRRSACVRLAMARCTIPEIAAITGHSYKRCEEILETYLPRTTEIARSAIERVLQARAAK
jgi:integrase